MTDLDRYGLFALAVVILLILFISLGEMDAGDECSDYSDCSLNGGVPARDLPVAGRRPEPGDVDVEIVDGDVEIVDVEDDFLPLRAGKGFDFEEDPVTYRGAPLPSAGGKSATALSGGVVRHRVRKGESLSSLSKKYYGSISYWPRIARANGGLSPEKLQAGMTVLIPATAGVKVSSAFAQPIASRKHIVKKNDSLTRISKQYYGTTIKWRRIYNANRDKISNPDVLQVGACLLVPR